MTKNSIPIPNACVYDFSASFQQRQTARIIHLPQTYSVGLLLSRLNGSPFDFPNLDSDFNELSESSYSKLADRDELAFDALVPDASVLDAVVLVLEVDTNNDINRTLSMILVAKRLSKNHRQGGTQATRKPTPISMYVQKRND